MKKYYEGLPAAANMEESIIQAQLQIVKDLERRKQSAAARSAADRFGHAPCCLAFSSACSAPRGYERAVLRRPRPAAGSSTRTTAGEVRNVRREAS